MWPCRLNEVAAPRILFLCRVGLHAYGKKADVFGAGAKFADADARSNVWVRPRPPCLPPFPIITQTALPPLGHFDSEIATHARRFSRQREIGGAAKLRLLESGLERIRNSLLMHADGKQSHWFKLAAT